MSSFTIAKSEYIKAAGLVAGLAQELKAWIFDYECQRNSTDEDFRRKFTECFEMNALSVKEQYRGDEVGAPSTDASSYMKEFKEYKNAGITLAIESGPALTNAINELSQFFSSAIYQTEKDSYMFKMQMYFDHIIVELFKQASHYECKSWGSLDIEKPKTTYTRIF